MSDWYDRQGKPIPDLLTWGRMMEDIKYRRVANTKVKRGVTVSTVWIGLNHRIGEGPPLIFETMVFGGPYDSYQERHMSEDQAKARHEEIVRRLRRHKKGEPLESDEEMQRAQEAWEEIERTLRLSRES